MAKWGKFDFNNFKNFAKAFEDVLDQNFVDQFIEDFLLEMAFRAQRKIKRRTPVDTGQLRRSWKVGKVERKGDNYIVEIYNNTEYAPYVEYGHRTGKNLTKWVEGRFMMTISMKEIEKELPLHLDKRIYELMRNIMNGKVPRKG